MKRRVGNLRFVARDSLQGLPMVSPQNGEDRMSNDNDSQKGSRISQQHEADCIAFLADYCGSLSDSCERLKRKADSHSLSICTLSLASLGENIRTSSLEIKEKIEEGDYIDIDKQSAGRLRWAHQYAFNMFKLYSHQVDSTMSSFNHTYLSTAIIDASDEAFRSRLRSLVVEFLITFSTRARLLSSTVHLAVSIMDRYLSKYSESGEQKSIKMAYFLQIGLGCLAIAVKLEERQPSFSSMVAPLIALWMVVFDEEAPLNCNNSLDGSISIILSKGANRTEGAQDTQELAQAVHADILSAAGIKYVKRSLASRELEVLKTLQWEPYSPTMLSFLGRYSVAANLSSNQSAIASCLCDRILIAYPLLVHPPDVQAAAVVSLVNALAGKPCWTATLQHTTGLSVDHLQACIKDIHAELSLEHTLRLQASSLPSFTLSPEVQKPIPEYIPGNSVRGKNQDYVYRALMPIPELSNRISLTHGPARAEKRPRRFQVSPGSEIGSFGTRRINRSALGQSVGNVLETLENSRENTESVSAQRSEHGQSPDSAGPTQVSAVMRRDVLAETFTAVVSALERLRRRGRHPSYSPSAQSSSVVQSHS